MVCFLYKTNPNPMKKNNFLWEKVAQMPLLNLMFLGFGLALGWRIRRFHDNTRMFSKPTEFGTNISPTP